jgi:hypothetical protein
VPEFIPGLELAGLYYHEAVRPILQAEAPELVYSAGLIGSGSEVLGFDTAMSADHSWGPRVILFLSEEDHSRLAGALQETLGYRLPFSFRGYPTHFEELADEPGVVLPRLTDRRPIKHRVEITTLPGFVRRYTGAELDRELTALDWLTIPEQKLRTLVAGAVYHDGLGVLEAMRQRLAHYPGQVWLYLLSAQWQRISQEEPFVGRTGFVGDEVGSAVIAARLVHDIMQLCFLMEKQYAPYAKWFGTAFAQLDCAGRLSPVLERILRSQRWREREEHLSAAYEQVTTMHNQLGITAAVPTEVSRFHNRPFMVIQAEAIAKAIWEAIEDDEVKALPYGVGKIDQYVNSTDILSHTDRCRKLGILYGE